MRVRRTGSSRFRMPVAYGRAPTRDPGRRRRDRRRALGRALLQAQQLAVDDEPLDLARALVDLGDLGVAVVALDRELLRVPVAAEDLDRLARLAARHLRGEELRLGARLGMRQVVLLQPR